MDWREILSIIITVADARQKFPSRSDWHSIKYIRFNLVIKIQNKYICVVESHAL